VITDANTAFLLYCCSFVNKNLAVRDGEKALHFAKIAVYDAVQFLDDKDIHFKQIVQNLEYSYQIALKVLP
jgi:hypothetical protein